MMRHPHFSSDPASQQHMVESDEQKERCIEACPTRRAAESTSTLTTSCSNGQGSITGHCCRAEQRWDYGLGFRVKKSEQPESRFTP